MCRCRPDSVLQECFPLLGCCGDRCLLMQRIHSLRKDGLSRGPCKKGFIVQIPSDTNILKFIYTHIHAYMHICTHIICMYIHIYMYNIICARCPSKILTYNNLRRTAGSWFSASPASLTSLSYAVMERRFKGMCVTCTKHRERETEIERERLIIINKYKNTYTYTLT